MTGCRDGGKTGERHGEGGEQKRRWGVKEGTLKILELLFTGQKFPCGSIRNLEFKVMKHHEHKPEYKSGNY